jgi:hypothetical protein
MAEGREVDDATRRVLQHVCCSIWGHRSIVAPSVLTPAAARSV